MLNDTLKENILKKVQSSVRGVLSDFLNIE